jgi:O-acetyl-ADP-ribose deacetylase
MEIVIINGDITKMEVDVIVNAANSSLLGGGGVDGAIHRKGRPWILDECINIRAKQGGCKVGEAVITTAGRLKAKKVIHTVGPKWNYGKDEQILLLKNCYINSLELAINHDLKTIAFPNISTGIYKYPKLEAAEIAIDAVRNFQEIDKIEKVIFVCHDIQNYEIYNKLLNP